MSSHFIVNTAVSSSIWKALYLCHHNVQGKVGPIKVWKISPHIEVENILLVHCEPIKCIVEELYQYQPAGVLSWVPQRDKGRSDRTQYVLFHYDLYLHQISLGFWMHSIANHVFYGILNADIWRLSLRHLGCTEHYESNAAWSFHAIIHCQL